MSLMNARRASNESFKTFETRFYGLVSEFISRGNDIYFPERLVALQRCLSAAIMNDGQCVSILSACISSMSVSNDTDFTTKIALFIKSISYSASLMSCISANLVTLISLLVPDLPTPFLVVQAKYSVDVMAAVYVSTMDLKMTEIIVKAVLSALQKKFPLWKLRPLVICARSYLIGQTLTMMTSLSSPEYPCMVLPWKQNQGLLPLVQIHLEPILTARSQ